MPRIDGRWGFRRTGTWSRAPACVFLLVLLVACSDSPEPPTEPDPDTTPPVILFEYPTSDTTDLGVVTSDYDDDGDGLLDLRLEWSDAGSGVDPSTFDLYVIGSGHHEKDVWSRISATGTGLLYEETLQGLMRSGRRLIVVSVADSAGNVAVDTLPVIMRYGDLHRSIHLDVPGETTVTSDLVVCEDDQRLYAASNYSIAVVDANTFEVIGVFPAVLSEPPASLLCIPGDPNLYATVRVNRFRRDSVKWTSNVSGTFFTDGLAHSRLDDAILWAGEFGRGTPERVDRIAEVRLGDPAVSLFPPSSFGNEFVFSIALLPEDEKIYFTRFWEQGVVVGDPATGEQLAHIDIDPHFSTIGRTSSIVLSPDDRFLYAALRGGDIGVAIVNTTTDETEHVINAPGGDPIYVALDASGSRLWLAVQDDSPTNPAPSLLIDPIARRILQEFPKPVPEGTITEWVQAATFHPNGDLLFEARDDFIDVYLIR